MKTETPSFQEISKNCPKGSDYCSGSSDECGCWRKARKLHCESLGIKHNL